MEFYKKSLSVGPVKFELTGQGLSVSARGLRIGSGPRGNHVQITPGTVLYRASPAGALRKPRRGFEAAARAGGAASPLEMRATNGAALLEQINRSLGFRAFWPLVLGLKIIGAAMILARFPHAWLAVMLLAIIIIATWICADLDAQRRTVVIMYDLDDPSLRLFRRLVQGLDGLTSRRIWAIDSAQNIHWKENAGATQQLRRRPVSMRHDVPDMIETNIDVPAIVGDGWAIHFFPDVVLTVERGRARAISYADFLVSWQHTTFIEQHHSHVPEDSDLIGHAWKYVNKNGGPDRRFKDNLQLPKVRYLQMSMTAVDAAVGFHRVLLLSRVSDHYLLNSTFESMRETSGVRRTAPQPAPLAQSTSLDPAFVGVLVTGALLVLVGCLSTASFAPAPEPVPSFASAEVSPPAITQGSASAHPVKKRRHPQRSVTGCRRPPHASEGSTPAQDQCGSRDSAGVPSASAPAAEQAPPPDSGL
jgi:hypothetical protein